MLFFASRQIILTCFHIDKKRADYLLVFFVYVVLLVISFFPVSFVICFLFFLVSFVFLLLLFSCFFCFLVFYFSCLFLFSCFLLYLILIFCFFAFPSNGFTLIYRFLALRFLAVTTPYLFTDKYFLQDFGTV